VTRTRAALAAVVLILASLAALAPAVSASAAQRRCTRDIHDARFVGETIAEWTSKCAYSAQGFAAWNDGVTRFGAKVHTGTASVVTEPTSLPLAKDNCDGYATYNSSGQQTSRVITFHKTGVTC
jgi:hypothetical protein